MFIFNTKKKKILICISIDYEINNFKPGHESSFLAIRFSFLQLSLVMESVMREHSPETVELQ